MFFLLLVFFADPLPSFNWWAVSVGGEELKWRQLAHYHLMCLQGPHYPHRRICVLTRNACLHLAYVSPPGERVPNRRMQLAHPTLGYAHKKSCPTVFKSIESLYSDRGMDRCHYAMPFKGISTRSTPEIVLSSKRN